MLKGIKAILFDFEGTLVDFQWKLADAEKDLLKELEKIGISSTELDDVRGYDEILNKAIEVASLGKYEILPQKLKERVDSLYDKYDHDALSRWQLLPASVDLLSSLKLKGLKLGLITNVGRSAIDEALARFGLATIFDVTVSRNDVLLLKPSGEGILSALSKLSIEKELCVFVGDSVSDILAARDAGVKVITVLGGQCAKDELLSYSPDYMISSIREVEKVVFC